MTKKIKVFGEKETPYTQKMISILRYRHIAYEVLMGDVPGRLSRLEGIESPKPILLPTLLLKDENGELKATTDTTPIIKRFENEIKDKYNNHDLEKIFTNQEAISNFNSLEFYKPETLLYEEIEKIWYQIENNDDWSLFNKKINSINEYKRIVSKNGLG